MTLSERIKTARQKRGLSQEEVAHCLGTSKQAISKYENGIVTNISLDKIQRMALLFGVSPEFLAGWEMTFKKAGATAIQTRKIPLFGEIACGRPIYAQEDIEAYIPTGDDIKADFCLRAKGDSMEGARIMDGDIVFIQQCDVVNNGEIAAVIIGDEATLKRVYYYKDKGKLVLQAENAKYEPLVYVGDELNEIKILGKAVAFQSDVR